MFLSYLRKKASRFQYDVLVHELTDCPTLESESSYFLSVERRGKRFRTKAAKPRTDSVRWFEVLSFGCTLYKGEEEVQFARKKYVFRLRADRGRLRSDLSAVINLAAFASKGIRHATLVFPLIGRSKLPANQPIPPGTPQLKLTIRCRWVNDVSKHGYSSCSSDTSKSELSMKEFSFSSHSSEGHSVLIPQAEVLAEFKDGDSAIPFFADLPRRGSEMLSFSLEEPVVAQRRMSATEWSQDPESRTSNAPSSVNHRHPAAPAPASRFRRNSMSSTTLPLSPQQSVTNLATLSGRPTGALNRYESDDGAGRVTALSRDTSLSDVHTAVQHSSHTAVYRDQHPPPIEFVALGSQEDPDSGSGGSGSGNAHRAARRLSYRRYARRGSTSSVGSGSLHDSPFKAGLDAQTFFAEQSAPPVQGTPFDPALLLAPTASKPLARPSEDSSAGTTLSASKVSRIKQFFLSRQRPVAVAPEGTRTARPRLYGPFPAADLEGNDTKRPLSMEPRSWVQELREGSPHLLPPFESAGSAQTTQQRPRTVPVLPPLASSFTTPPRNGLSNKDRLFPHVRTSPDRTESSPVPIARPAGQSPGQVLYDRPLATSPASVQLTPGAAQNQQHTLPADASPSPLVQPYLPPSPMLLSFQPASRTSPLPPEPTQSALARAKLMPSLSRQLVNAQEQQATYYRPSAAEFLSSSASMAAQADSPPRLDLLPKSDMDSKPSLPTIPEQQSLSPWMALLQRSFPGSFPPSTESTASAESKELPRVSSGESTDDLLRKYFANDQSSPSGRKVVAAAPAQSSSTMLPPTNQSTIITPSSTLLSPASPTAIAVSTPAADVPKKAKEVLKKADLAFIAYASLQHVTPYQEGHFGYIFCATWDAKRVVVKVPKHKPGADEWSELFSFLEIPTHPNVLPFLGICRDFADLRFPAFCLVTELQKCSVRDLVSTILAADESARAKEAKLVRIALEMAYGVAHLHTHGIVHRDIALRNFLVSAGESIVICDFGLSRQVADREDSYYRIGMQSALPIRWMAPEALLTHKCSRASDCWMFGVTLWELITGGSQEPYAQTETFNQVMVGVCTGALQLDKPEGFEGLWRVVQSCCSLAADQRPTMAKVIAMLQDQGAIAAEK